MKQLPITKSQKKIILYLFKFRYLRIEQLQFLFNHKDPHRIKEWLTDLKQKKYISIIKDPKSITKPYIICLEHCSKKILEQDDDIDKKSLKYLYKDKNYSEEFINRNLFIADSYIYFLKTKENDSEINFFTRQDLKEYNYFPEDLPDAYIDLKVENETSRYFLDYFDSEAKPGKVRYRIRSYFEYFNTNNWQENTDNAPFPAVLMVFANKYRKKHAHYYAKSLFKKSIVNDFQLFIALKDDIQSPRDNVEVWQSVEDRVN